MKAGSEYPGKKSRWQGVRVSPTAHVRHAAVSAQRLFVLCFILFLGTAGTPEKASTLKPLVQGRRGVVAAGHPLVAEAGLRILEQGGNAVDAGIASVFAASVVEMTSFGLGGECPILIKPANGPVIVINGVGTAPGLATVDYYRGIAANDPRVVKLTTEAGDGQGTIPSYGALSAVVPGAVDALLLALEEFGTLKFSDVIEPALELAEGFPLDARVADRLELDQAAFSRWPESQKIYMPGGRLPKEGELFVQADLAHTFQEMIAAERRTGSRARGAGIESVRDDFYRGTLARQISDFCRQEGCLIRQSDLAAYHARVENPLHTNYRGIDVYKSTFWGQGPAFLETLNLLEGFNLRSLGLNSTDYVHLVVEATKLALADRDAYYGDPDFSAIPVALISKPYADIRRLLIQQHASAEHIPGDPIELRSRAPEDFARARLSGRSGDHKDTTGVNVIDKSGTMFSAVPSGAWIPALIVSHTGIPLSQRMQSFVLTPGHPNQLAPNKRPRVTLTPTLALRDGKPWLAFSTPGGDWQDQCLLQVFLNIVEFEMNPQEAVEAPRFYTNAMYSSFDDHSDKPLSLQVENRFSSEVVDGLQLHGHHVVLVENWTNRNAPTVVEFSAATGTISAGADVSGYRYAIGW
jgi:gamma-glutamyltranspeptidase/glutathione hydrolase